MDDHPTPTPAADLTPEEWESEVAQARATHLEILKAIADGKDALWRLAKALYEFREERGWQKLNYDSLNQYLADPELGIKRATFFRLTGLWHELVVIRAVPALGLADIDTSKADMVLPAVKAGKPLQDALSDAKVLSYADLRVKYQGAKDPLEDIPTQSDDDAPDDEKASEDAVGAALEAEDVLEVSESSNGAEPLTEDESEPEDPLPGMVGLCPIHYGEFYLPLTEGESRRCPEAGCENDLVVYVREQVDA